MKTLRVPIVWVLHAAYAWIPLHLALRATAELGWIAAFGGDACADRRRRGGLIIGMMTRTARGHTGRPLRGRPQRGRLLRARAAAAVVRVFGAAVGTGLDDRGRAACRPCSGRLASRSTSSLLAGADATRVDGRPG